MSALIRKATRENDNAQRLVLAGGNPQVNLLPCATLVPRSGDCLETNPRRIVSPGRFGIVVGIALLLYGLGFGILAAGGALRGADAGFHFFGKRTPENVAAPVPTV